MTTSGDSSARLPDAEGPHQENSAPTAALRIGTLELDLPFVQAALAGYSDLPMRRMARKHGAPYTMSEVVLDRLVTDKGKTRKRVLHVEPDDHPIGGQLMGADPPAFAAAAANMVEAGYDVIDLNFACPVRKVLSRCRGGYLLSDPKTALDIVRRVLDAVDRRRPVTLKMRCGMNNDTQSEKHFFTILDGAYEAGIDAVTLHGRTVHQRYVGPSDWAFVHRVKKHVGDRVLLGSGDLFSAERCIRMLTETGVDGATIARGCIANPWIFTHCRELYAGRPLPPPPTVPEQGTTIAEHFAEVTRAYDDHHAWKVMRKLGIKYSDHHPNAHTVRDAFVAARCHADVNNVLTTWYDPTKQWPPTTHRDRHGEHVPAGR